ncbi:MAG: hypothetical protein S4CHLAM81_06990 [Chlamydiales bacterium]|nr:hypothetical protein [Chlamydiales bacterium]MCH9635483.1 hypothetical protein [Chlamydiales bacterium]MCH9704015.1 hypothetical protein [Chlamydiota bacterium]
MRLLFFLLLPIQLFAQHIYIVHGRSGEIADNKFILHNVDQSIVYFSQDGKRQAGSMPLTTFLQKWEKEHLFGKEGASAHYVSYMDWDTHYNAMPIHLTNPSYDKESESLLFVIPEKTKTEKLGETALFLTHE